MYLYNVGYGTCEESSYNQYYHENNYSQEEFEKIIILILCETIEDFAGKFDEQTGWNKIGDSVLWVTKKGVTFQELMGTDIFKNNLKKHGFQQITFQASFDSFGWASAMEPGDWSSWANNDDNRYQTMIKNFCKYKNIVIEQYKDKDGDRDNYRLNYKK